MSEDVANPETGAIEPMTVADAAEAFKGLRSDPATPEPEPEQVTPEPEAQPEPEQAEAEPEIEVSESETPEEAATAPERYTVKIGGQERKVTLDELKKGYQLEADYRQKTATLADERRTLEAERQSYKDRLDKLVPTLESAAQSKWAKVDWQTLANEDPARYVALHAEYQQDAALLAQARAEQYQLEQVRTQTQEKQHKEYLSQQYDLLKEKIPALKDPEKAKVTTKAISDYLMTEGFTQEEVDSLGDHRAGVIAWKAMQYDKAVKAKKAATAKASPAPPVQKPGVQRPASTDAEKTAAAITRLGKTGSVDDAAAVFKAAGIFRQG